MASFSTATSTTATDRLHKWAQDHSQPLIEANVTGHKSYAFTCVRNPYTRILSSSFFDKICGIQRNGKPLSRQPGAAPDPEIRDRGGFGPDG